MVVKPQPVTVEFLSDRIEGMTQETSAAIHGTFVKGGMLGADDRLLEDPRYPALNIHLPLCFEGCPPIHHATTLRRGTDRSSV